MKIPDRQLWRTVTINLMWPGQRIRYIDLQRGEDDEGHETDFQLFWVSGNVLSNKNSADTHERIVKSKILDKINILTNRSRSLHWYRHPPVVRSAW